VESINGIGPKTAELFKKLTEKNRLIDVLFHKPIALRYRPRLTKAEEIKSEDFPTFKVRVISHTKPKTKKQPYRILCQIQSFKSCQLEIVFFNYRKDYLIQLLPEGEIRWISGAVEWYNSRLQMSHPDYITTELDEWKIPLIEPIYPLTAGLTNKTVEFTIREAIKSVPEFAEWLDERLIQTNNWPSFKDALKQLHHPQSNADLTNQNKARQRLAYDEILSGQLALAIMRSKFKKQKGL
jgi:ATP-dependent DNA helicase RecG